MLGHNPVVLHRLALVKASLQSAISLLDSSAKDAANFDSNNKMLISIIEDAILLLKRDEKIMRPGRSVDIGDDQCRH